MRSLIDCPGNCGRTVDVGKLTCFRCWSKVPPRLQTPVNRSWAVLKRAKPDDPNREAKRAAYEDARAAALKSIGIDA